MSGDKPLRIKKSKIVDLIEDLYHKKSVFYGDEITNFNQVKIIARSILSSATFKIKFKEKKNPPVLETYTTNLEIQDYISNEQISLAPNKYFTNETKSDESIIDVNSENFDLTVEHQPSIKNGKQKEPPYWGHTYVYSALLAIGWQQA